MMRFVNIRLCGQLISQSNGRRRPKQFPQFKRPFEIGDPILLVTEGFRQVEEAVNERVDGTFQDLIEQLEHTEAFGYKMTSWLIPIPQGYNAKQGIDTLEWSFTSYAIVSARRYEAS